jgi:hypothetical protein
MTKILSELTPGDTVLRPFFGTTEVVKLVRPRTPRARKYFTVEFESGESWTNDATYLFEVPVKTSAPATSTP